MLLPFEAMRQGRTNAMAPISAAASTYWRCGWTVGIIRAARPSIARSRGSAFAAIDGLGAVVSPAFSAGGAAGPSRGRISIESPENRSTRSPAFRRSPSLIVRGAVRGSSFTARAGPASWTRATAGISSNFTVASEIKGRGMGVVS